MEPTSSVWLEERYTPSRPLKGREECSIAIIGGGVVGVTAAYFLAKAGCQVALLEHGSVASGATGRSAGILMEGLQQHYSMVQLSHGRDNAKTLWRLSRDNVALMEDLIREERLSCGFERRGSYRVSVTEQEYDVVCQSAKMLNQDGFPAELILPARLRTLFPGSSFAGGIYYPENAEVHPVQFVRGIAEAARRAGARIHELTPVQKMEGTTLTTDEGTVQAEMVLIATNALAPKLHRFFQEVIAPVRGQCFVTEKFPETVIPAPVSTNWGLDFFRQLPDGRFLMTGGRHISIETEYTYQEKPTEPIQAYLEGFLHQQFPATRNLKITHRWAGIMGFSCDDLPTVGPLPGTVHTYAAAGFHGNGLRFGVICGRMVAEMMLEGRTEFPARIFSPRRHTP